MTLQKVYLIQNRFILPLANHILTSNVIACIHIPCEHFIVMLSRNLFTPFKGDILFSFIFKSQSASFFCVNCGSWGPWGAAFAFTE